MDITNYWRYLRLAESVHAEGWMKDLHNVVPILTQWHTFKDLTISLWQHPIVMTSFNMLYPQTTQLRKPGMYCTSLF